MAVKGWVKLTLKNLVAQNVVSLRRWLSLKSIIKLSGGQQVSHQGFLEYIIALGKVYQGSDRNRKGQLLRDAVEITRKSERTILRYLGENPEALQKRINEQNPILPGRGRKALYDEPVLRPHIKALWKWMERISATRMKAALPEWLRFYKSPELSDFHRVQLQLLSRSTLERMLVSIRGEERAEIGISTTQSARRQILNEVPLNRFDQEITRPGFAQADTVAHCGTSAAGVFLNTMTLADVYSGWTVNYVIQGKKAQQVRKGFVNFKRSLPFTLKAVNTDSGSEFINDLMIGFMHGSGHPEGAITFTRSRPYKKNDNCYVEQRNYTHVRSLFGYARYEHSELLAIMNDIYENYWNPLHNFFLPSQKLLEKKRVGSKIVKKHDQPRTPYERLIASPELSQEQKDQLSSLKALLNPIELAEGLERKLKTFFDLARKLSTAPEAQNEPISTEQAIKQFPETPPEEFEFRPINAQISSVDRRPELSLKNKAKKSITRKDDAA